MKVPFVRLSTLGIDLRFQYRYCNIEPRVVRPVPDRVIKLDKLITHRFKMEDVVKAFETTADPEIGAIKV